MSNESRMTMRFRRARQTIQYLHSIVPNDAAGRHNSTLSCRFMNALSALEDAENEANAAAAARDDLRGELSVSKKHAEILAEENASRRAAREEERDDHAARYDALEQEFAALLNARNEQRHTIKEMRELVDALRQTTDMQGERAGLAQAEIKRLREGIGELKREADTRSGVFAAHWLSRQYRTLLDAGSEQVNEGKDG